MTLTLAWPNLILKCESKNVKEELPRMQVRPFISRKVQWGSIPHAQAFTIKMFYFGYMSLTHMSWQFSFPFKIQPKGSPPITTYVKSSLTSPLPLAEVGTLFFSLTVSCPYNPNSYAYWMPLHSRPLSYSVQFLTTPSEETNILL